MTINKITYLKLRSSTIWGILYCLLSFLATKHVTAQPQQGYQSFNIYNGLTSNHVYNSFIDRHGYLWLTTPNGVIKYNGYSFRIYNASDGLPREDVWLLTEDKRGRIWLGCITDELGYIYNDKYYSVNLNNNHNIFYPHSICTYDSGIAFATSYVNKDLNVRLYTIDKDSLHRFNLPDSLFLTGKTFASAADSLLFLRDTLKNWPSYTIIFHDSILVTFLTNRFYSITLRNGKPFNVQSVLIRYPDVIKIFSNQIISILVDNLYLSLPGAPKDYFFTINRKNGEVKQIYIGDGKINERIQYIHHMPNDSICYVITKAHLLKYKLKGDDCYYLGERPFQNIFKDTVTNGNEIVSINWNSLWGSIYTTKSRGIAIISPYPNFFMSEKINLNGYKLVGLQDKKTSLWWSSTLMSLARIDNTKIIFSNFVNIGIVNNIIPYRKDTLLALGNPTNAFLTHNASQAHILDIYHTLGAGISTAYFIDEKKLIAASNYGFIIDDLHSKRTVLNNNRFTNLVSDPSQNEYWAYNNSHIAIYNHTNKTIREYDKTLIKKLGLSSIESICIDTLYHNIFIQDNNNLYVFNKKCIPVQQLKNINIKGAYISVIDNKLVIAGKIGVIVLPILGANNFGQPHLFPNENNYIYMLGLCTIAGQAQLNTDRGFFRIDITDSQLAKTPLLSRVTNEYIFTYRYQQQLYDAIHDTLALDQKDLRLQFDIINPNGSGQVRYSASFDTMHIRMQSNELNLPVLQPDNYYILTVAASDDIWKSNPHILTLYVKPYWYQTHFMVRVIWSVIVLGFIAVVVISILVTRRIVINANRKRNLRMELELKSIYSQINPHFIFNSLNSALLLVSKGKMEDAYLHISKFSKLLRSYIKSSRNKLIRLEEELVNLRNYIDLQQIRFKDKFDYKVNVDPLIDVANTYIPSLLLQPFIENAIEHGLLNKNDKGHLLITFKKELQENKILCIIDDDGIGRRESKLNKIPNPVKDESYGELLIKDLVNIFNKYEHMNIHVGYHDKEAPLTGTVVTVAIKTK